MRLIIWTMEKMGLRAEERGAIVRFEFGVLKDLKERTETMMNTMMSGMTSERMAGMMMPGMNGMMGMPMAGSTMPGMGSGMMPGMMMAPRCTMKMEKCPGGMKIMCMCDDKTSAEMMKNLCMMTQGGMMSCCMMMNGMMCCCCNLGMMGMCKMEMMEMGCMMTCTSGATN